jgi:hypothetical protein
MGRINEKGESLQAGKFMAKIIFLSSFHSELERPLLSWDTSNVFGLYVSSL